MNNLYRNNLTQELLKEYLHYSKETGIFTWIKDSHTTKNLVGKEAGCKSRDHIEIRLFGTLYLAHRLAYLYVEGKFPKKHIDHIDHNEENNCWNNLRKVTQRTNNMNNSLRCDNSTGTTGVWFSNYKKRYIAEIIYQGVKHHLGTFTDINKAIKARKKAEKFYGFHKNHGIKKPNVHK